MNIPKKIKVAGYNMEVVMINDRTSDHGDSSPATFNSRRGKIWIDKAQSREQQESSLIHEILEALDYHYELKLEHRTISILETALYQVLKDNKLIQ